MALDDPKPSTSAIAENLEERVQLTDMRMLKDLDVSQKFRACPSETCVVSCIRLRTGLSVYNWRGSDGSL